MDAKHRIVQLLGIAGVLSGCLLAILGLTRLFLGHIAVGDVWAATGLVFVFAFLAYLISLGIRGLRWAKGEETVRNGQIKWGRVYLGALLIFINVENHFHPAPNLLKPSNETQALAMNATAVALALLGAWLVVSGIRSRLKRRVDGGESSKIVP